MELKEKYGRLTPTKRFQRKVISGRERVVLELLCDCGTIIWRAKDYMYQSKTPSCGCAIKDVVGLSTRYKKGDGATHGMTESSEYGSWKKMISRCEDPNQHGYERYGGRGITIFPEWRKNFAAFYAHIGPKPTEIHSVGRIDYDKNYEPGNVRWETPKEQGLSRSDNRIIEHNGQKMPMIYWIESLKLPNRFVTERTILGWSIQDCLDYFQDTKNKDKIFSAVARNKFRSQYWAGIRHRPNGKSVFVPFPEYTYAVT
jgi:hypothetical protein